MRNSFWPFSTVSPRERNLLLPRKESILRLFYSASQPRIERFSTRSFFPAGGEFCPIDRGRICSNKYSLWRRQVLYVYVFPGNRFEGIKFAHFRIFFFASWKREKFAEEFFLSLSRERREKGRFDATEEEER